MNLFNIIKHKKAYWLVDQVKLEGKTKEDYQSKFTKLLKEYEANNIGYLSLLMEEEFEPWLLSKGFRKISVIHEYRKALENEQYPETEITYHALSEGRMTDIEFANIYELCRLGTANKNIQQPIEEVMASIRDELGDNWRSNCFYFLLKDEVVGISIPHIEMGTKDEGRMFYFGIVPKKRGEGLGAKIHKITLTIMKSLNATYYIGSTDESNEHMLHIFRKNGCTLRNKKGIYRIGK